MTLALRGPILVLLSTVLACGSVGPEESAVLSGAVASPSGGVSSQGAPVPAGGSNTGGSASSSGGAPGELEVVRPIGSGGEPQGPTSALGLTELMVEAKFLPSVAYAIQNQEDLADRLPEGSTLAGVTEDPTTGQRYVLDPERGIYAVGTDSADLIFALGAIVPTESELPASAFTDIAALGHSRFALTAINDGFILDLEAQRMWQHFCYLPEGPNYVPGQTSISVKLALEGREVWQGTESLTYERETGLLWAQPRTFAVGDDQALGSEVASFDLATGVPQRWLGFTNFDMRAGGMAVTPASYVLGSGSMLYAIDRTSGRGGVMSDFAADGISDITGLSPTGTDAFLMVERDSLTIYTLGVEPQAAAR